MFIKPKPGVLVRDPISKQLLPPEGRNVEQSGFWLRRIREGGVEVVTPVPAPAQDLLAEPKKDAKK
jgi:hypothetical protein